jgi:hypothetical protein
VTSRIRLPELTAIEAQWLIFLGAVRGSDGRAHSPTGRRIRALLPSGTTGMA